MFATFIQDLRYAARMLRRTPGFTLISVTTMALAIGANTAIFSIVNGVLLKALPFEDPERLVVLGHHTDGGDSLDSTTPGNFYDWQARATAFESMAAFSPTERIFTWEGNAERIRGGMSIGSIFEVLGRRAIDGRAFSAAEDAPGANPVVVFSTTLARRLFGARSPVGATIGINGVAHTIIGVMPADFAFFDYDYEYWIPARFDAGFRTNRDQYFLAGLARLKPGVTVSQARAQLDTVMDGIRREYPQFTQNATAAVVPMKDQLVDDVRTRLLTLMGAVVFILLMACANLGNLLLARASSRRREVAAPPGASDADRERAAGRPWRSRGCGTRVWDARAARQVGCRELTPCEWHHARCARLRVHGRGIALVRRRVRAVPRAAARDWRADGRGSRRHAWKRAQPVDAHHACCVGTGACVDAARRRRAARAQLHEPHGRAARLPDRAAADVHHVGSVGHLPHARRARGVPRARRANFRGAARRPNRDDEHDAARVGPRQRRLVQHD
jgi:hypothetical protein